VKRCSWAKNELAIAYHDTEWGVPVHDDRVLFEFLILEGAQAGLSWDTILRKREAYRKAFAVFDPARVARFTDKHVERLMLDSGIVRKRLEIRSAIKNARGFLQVRSEFGSFAAYLWGFARAPPRELSDRISKDIVKRGFSVVGTTIVYTYLQAIGIVNDHRADCPSYRELR